uniref:WGS project CAEQ00000000 data, annotated contig 952 n=1 Tax=Trypanosoma congolense (strain IL3000) TaxID=1068625 RepID=F9WJU5_TRYCI|nr:unnamed protein product [Trypanosoma congolense IL3000]
MVFGGVLFPQRCCCISHALGSNGELWTAMIAGRQLLVLCDKNLCASGPLPGAGDEDKRENGGVSPSRTSDRATSLAVCRIRYSDTNGDVRIVVVASGKVTVVCLERLHMQLHYHPVCVSAAEDVRRGAFSAAASDVQMPAYLAWWRPTTAQKTARNVLDAEFVTDNAIVVLCLDEVVLIELQEHKRRGETCEWSGETRLSWRICMSYIKLAVCRVGLYLAVSTQSSIVEIFPLRTRLRSKRGPSKQCVVAAPQPILQTPQQIDAEGQELTSSRPYAPSQLEAADIDAFVWRGASTRLGGDEIVALEWHRVSRRSFLCVTCRDKDSGQLYISFFRVWPYTVMEAPRTRAKVGDLQLNVVVDSESSTSYGIELMLVPAGKVLLSSVSPGVFSSFHVTPSQMHSRCDDPESSVLELLCIEDDGTVVRTNFHFDQQGCACLVRRSNRNSRVVELLGPIQKDFGKIVETKLLPSCSPRGVLFGTLTPYAERLAEARLYRLVLHFQNGMIAKVVVDPTRAAVRVEAFLTLGVDVHPPLITAITVDAVTGPQQLFLGFTRKRVFVIKHVLRSGGMAEASVPAVAPVPEECFQRFVGEFEEVRSNGTHTETKDGGSVDDVEAVKLFMEARCPEKLRMMPALLKACDGDATKLLKQLRTKYALVESPVLRGGTTGHEEKNDAVCQMQRSQFDPTSPRLLMTALQISGLKVASDGIYCRVELSVSDPGRGQCQQHWYIPILMTESSTTGEIDVTARDVFLPAMAPVKCLDVAPLYDTPPCGRLIDVDVMRVDWDASTNALTMHSTVLPHDPPLQLQPLEDMPHRYSPVKFDWAWLVSGDLIVCVMGATNCTPPETVLVVYVLDTLRNIASQATFERELVIHDVAAFFIGDYTGLFVLQHDTKSIVRWRRVTTNIGDTNSSQWKKFVIRDGSEPCEAVVAAAPLWEESGSIGGVENSRASFTRLVCVSPEDGVIKICETSPAQNAQVEKRNKEQAGDTDVVHAPGGATEMENYHPTVMSLLLAMRRTRMVQYGLRCILGLPNGSAGDTTNSESEVPRRIAEALCRNPVNTASGDFPDPVSTEGMHTADAVVRDSSFLCDHATLRAQLEEEESQCDYTAAFGAGIPPELLDDVLSPLMQVSQPGLSSQDQLALLCTVEALRATRLSDVAADPSASRYLFSHKLDQLRRRQRVSVPNMGSFPMGHASFMWAALSDVQQQLLGALFASDNSALPWADVESSGVSFWVRSLHSLRGIAERVAREKFQQNRDVRECALMYCLARRAGVIAALCRTTGNPKLEAFFSRDFSDPKNRAAASTNAYAAVSKNLLEYSAAFFVLAGEARNAAQVLLQRQGNVPLALFVMRLACDDDPSDMVWFMEQRRREAEHCGAMSFWEEACLLWRCGQRRESLMTLARQPPLCAVEAADRFALLTFAGRRGAAEKLPLQETVPLLMRTARLSCATGMKLAALACCREVESWLQQLLKESEGSGKSEKFDTSASTCSKAPPRIVADLNTGTLTFGGFGMDDDEGVPETSPKLDVVVSETCTSGVAGKPVTKKDFPVDHTAVLTLSRELEFLRKKFCSPSGPPVVQEHQKAECSAAANAVLICTARLLIADGSSSPLVGVETHLRKLLECLPSIRQDHSDPENYSCESGGAGLRLVIVALGLVLMSAAARNGDYALASALLGLSTIDDVLMEERAETVTVHTVAVYMRTVYGVLDDVRVLTGQWCQRAELKKEEKVEENQNFDGPETGGNETFSFLFSNPFEDDINRGFNFYQEADKAEREEEEDNEAAHRDTLRTALFSWCAAHLHLCALKELHRETARLRAVLHGPTSTHTLLQMWLLSYLLCRVTLRFNSAADRLMGAVFLIQKTNETGQACPNGIFMEVLLQLRHMIEVLERDVPSISCPPLNPDGTKTLEQQHARYSMLLSLCVTNSDALWQLPVRNTNLSVTVEAALMLLSDATSPHTAEHLLCGRLTQSTTSALRLVEATWLQRYHTSRSYRDQFLVFPPGGRTSAVVSTNRLILQQSDRPVCAVDYDRYSCDAIVWSTAVRVVVRNGCTSVLLKGAESPPEEQVQGTTPRLHPSASAVQRANPSFVEMMFGPVSGEGKPESNNRKMLSNRPSLPLLDGSDVTAHPHLPFFSAPHEDGCIDLYSFTGTRCVKTFDCGSSRAATSVAYSVEGNMFVAGLMDGRVAGWRFDVTPAERAALPLFVYHVLPAGGIRTVTFCGDSQSMVAVAGFSYDTGLSDGCGAQEKESSASPLGEEGIEDLRRPEAQKTVRAGLFGFRKAAFCERSATGYLLILDLVLRPGTYACRELPFIPKHAVYLERLESVVCVAADGAVALYDIWKSRLHTFAPSDKTITCAAVSSYDDIIALGTADGCVLLLHSHGVREAASACHEEFQCAFAEGDAQQVLSSEKCLLSKASTLRLVSEGAPLCDVQSVVFSPSVLLAGLADGKIIAASLMLDSTAANIC